MKLILAFALLTGAWTAQAATKTKHIDPNQLIKRAEDQSLGKTFWGKLKMKIHREDSDRELEIATWAEKHDRAMVKILSPMRDQGIGNLRLALDLWQYLPKVERLIKIPSSSMLQSWMGSDFTNDDLVRTSSLSRDYTHQFVHYETINGIKAAKIICTPKPDAPVVWGRLELWIDPVRAVTVQEDFYSERGELLKRMSGSKIKKFGSHTIASELSMKTFNKNSTTTIVYKEAHFDEALNSEVFNQNFLKTPVTKL